MSSLQVSKALRPLPALLRCAAPLLLAALGLLAPEVLAAEEGHAEAEHGPSWWMLFFHILNFSILMFVLFRYAGPVILDFLAQRSRGIRSRIEMADERLRAAETELAGLRDRLASFEDEEARILSFASEQGERAKTRAIERAHDTAQRIREDAERVANQEIARARQILREEAAELATELAAELLRQNLSEDDDQRLVQEFVERVGGGGDA